MDAETFYEVTLVLTSLYLFITRWKRDYNHDAVEEEGGLRIAKRGGAGGGGDLVILLDCDAGTGEISSRLVLAEDHLVSVEVSDLVRGATPLLYDGFVLVDDGKTLAEHIGPGTDVHAQAARIAERRCSAFHPGGQASVVRLPAGKRKAEAFRDLWNGNEDLLLQTFSHAIFATATATAATDLMPTAHGRGIAISVIHAGRMGRGRAALLDELATKMGAAAAPDNRLLLVVDQEVLGDPRRPGRNDKWFYEHVLPVCARNKDRVKLCCTSSRPRRPTNNSTGSTRGPACRSSYTRHERRRLECNNNNVFVCARVSVCWGRGVEKMARNIRHDSRRRRLFDKIKMDATASAAAALVVRAAPVLILLIFVVVIVVVVLRGRSRRWRRREAFTLQDARVYKRVIDAFHRVLERNPTPAELDAEKERVQSDGNTDQALQRLADRLAATDEHRRLTTMQTNAFNADLLGNVTVRQAELELRKIYKDVMRTSAAPPAEHMRFLMHKFTKEYRLDRQKMEALLRAVRGAEERQRGASKQDDKALQALMDIISGGPQPQNVEDTQEAGEDALFTAAFLKRLQDHKKKNRSTVQAAAGNLYDAAAEEAEHTTQTTGKNDPRMLMLLEDEDLERRAYLVPTQRPPVCIASSETKEPNPLVQQTALLGTLLGDARASQRDAEENAYRTVNRRETAKKT